MSFYSNSQAFKKGTKNETLFLGDDAKVSHINSSVHFCKAWNALWVSITVVTISLLLIKIEKICIQKEGMRLVPGLGEEEWILNGNTIKRKTKRKMWPRLPSFREPSPPRLRLPCCSLALSCSGSVHSASSSPSRANAMCECFVN